MVTNEAMIETLTLLKREAETTHGQKARPDFFRARAFGKALDQIHLFGKEHGRDIANEADVRSMHGLGASMVTKLLEMLETGKLRQAEEARANGRSEAVAELMGVWGAGRAHCNRWFDEGVRTLADLRRRTAEGSLKLTDNQTVGMRHYEDLGQRIPREEVAIIERIVREEGQRISPGLTVQAVGSYRRGAATCGDIDILISHADGRSHLILHKLVQRLHAVGLLQHDLTTSGVCKEPQDSADRWGGGKKVDKHFESNSEMHMAVCKLPSQHMPELERSLRANSGGSGSGGSGDGDGSGGSSGVGGGGGSSEAAGDTSGAFQPTHYYDGKSLVAHNSSGLALGLFRRIDLKTYPADRFAFALLYFTGSKELNTKMRYHARQNFSLLLSDKELVPVQEGWKHGKWVGVGVGRAEGGGKRKCRFSHTCCPPCLYLLPHSAYLSLAPLVFVASPRLFVARSHRFWHRLQAHQGPTLTSLLPPFTLLPQITSTPRISLGWAPR
jgi:DNA polymerase/3'-5' exonuclease PolX